MPADVTALGGNERKRNQFPLSFVLLAIPGFAHNALNTSDRTLYLNVATNAGSMFPGAGLTAFEPYAGFKVPQIKKTDQAILSVVEIQASNVGRNGAPGDWTAVLAANAYRGTPVTIWQANAVLPAGSPPQAATFTGAMVVWMGILGGITPGRTKATISLSPLSKLWSVAFPYRTYSAPDFKHLPPENMKLSWGFTEEELDSSTSGTRG